MIYKQALFLVQLSQVTDKILPRLSDPLSLEFLTYWTKLCQQAPLTGPGSELDPGLPTVPKSTMFPSCSGAFKSCTALVFLISKC